MTPAKIEQQPAEGAFLACTLWLADAYVLTGEIDKAQELFTRVVAVANDLGLLAEEYDSTARRQTGNFPQALTHIALINTAHNLCGWRSIGREACDAALEVVRAWQGFAPIGSSGCRTREPASVFAAASRAGLNCPLEGVTVGTGSRRRVGPTKRLHSVRPANSSIYSSDALDSV